MGSQSVVEGDEIRVLEGKQVPFKLRRDQAIAAYRFCRLDILLWDCLWRDGSNYISLNWTYGSLSSRSIYINQEEGTKEALRVEGVCTHR